MGPTGVMYRRLRPAVSAGRIRTGVFPKPDASGIDESGRQEAVPQGNAHLRVQDQLEVPPMGAPSGRWAQGVLLEPRTVVRPPRRTFLDRDFRRVAIREDGPGARERAREFRRRPAVIARLPGEGPVVDLDASSRLASSAPPETNIPVSG